MSNSEKEDKFKSLCRIVLRNEERLNKTIEETKKLTSLIKGMSEVQSNHEQRIKNIEKEI